MPSEASMKRDDLRVTAVSIPPFFRCPISLELMTDPVSLCTGVTYERASIEKWLDDGNNVCPATMQILQNQELIPNHTLRRLIQEWCVANSSSGVVRVPTPRPVAEPDRVRQALQDIRLGVNKLEALRGLKNLAKASERNRKCMRAVGVLPALVRLLDGSTEAPDGPGDSDGARVDALQEAIGVVACFSIDGDDNAAVRTDLARPSVLRTVEWLLRRGNLEARMSAAAVVEKLASNDRSLAREIGSRDGITDGLLTLFEENIRDHQYPAAFKASLKALLHLCSVVRNRAKIAEAGAVPGLVELLPGADRGMTEQSLAILEMLSTTWEGRSAIVGHALAVPTIVRSLLVVSDTATDYAVGILLGICFNSPDDDLLAEVVQMGTFERLLMLLQMECSPRTRHKANELLRLLSFFRHDDSSSCASSLEL